MDYSELSRCSNGNILPAVFDCSRAVNCLVGESAAGATQSGNDIGRELVLEICQPVAQDKFSLLQPLNLQPVAGAELEQRLYRGIKITMLLPQALKLRLQVSAIFLAQFFRHAQPYLRTNRFSKVYTSAKGEQAKQQGAANARFREASHCSQNSSLS